MATDIPVTLNAIPHNATYNTFAVTAFANPYGIGAESDTETTYAGGTCPMSLNVLFDLVSHQGTILGLSAILQNPGTGTLSNASFQLQWFGGFVTESGSMSNVASALYTPSPPTPVSNGLFAADLQRVQLNGGTLTSSGDYDSTTVLSSQPVDGPNMSSSSGSIALGSPTMYGTVATYPVSFQMPIAFSQDIGQPVYGAGMTITGLLSATGQLQFNFGPPPATWNVGSGSWSIGGNWTNVISSGPSGQAPRPCSPSPPAAK